jgi:beta-lactamase regulating signal transducer with metallopeptidase domain
MISALHLQVIAEASAARLVGCLVEGTLIALCAALALRLRQQNSGTRFAIWFSALMAIASMPFLASALNSIQALRNATPTAVQHSAITLPASWALYLFAAWAVIASLSLSRVVISLGHIRTLRKSCTAIDPGQFNPSIRETLNSVPSIALCTSDQVQVPTAVGFFKPAVVIPAWLLNDLSPEELNQILLHEIAHLRRRDDWTNLAQQIVKALFFFHPAVWWIERKLSLEREMACDDAVLAATAQPRAYAECLAHLAEKTFIHRSIVAKGIALAQAALGRMRHTTLRVAEILNPNRQRVTKQNWKPALSLIAAFAVGSSVLAAKEPQLIAFRDSNTLVEADAFVRPGERNSRAASTIDSSIESTLKPVRAVFVPPQTSRLGVFSRSHIASLRKPLPAKSTNLAASTLTPNVERASIEQIQNADPGIFAFIIESSTAAPNLIHPANLTTDSAVSTQTIFLIVQDPSSAASQPIYQIHFWQVTVFHPATASKHIPNKET